MIQLKNKAAIAIFLMAFIFASCTDTNIDSFPQEDKTDSEITPSLSSIDDVQRDRTLDLNSLKSMHEINESLAANGLNIRLSYAETVTPHKQGSDQMGQTIYANDRQKRLTAQWVPGDTRREADGNNLNYLIYKPFAWANFGTGNQINSSPAIDSSFDTWNSIKKNAKLSIIKRADTGIFPSAIFIGGNPFVADIVELGFLPGFIFDTVLGPGSSQNVLGVTFTFVFIDGQGNPTDINGDSFDDVALKEVWYNDDFLWKTNPAANGIDIETVALHENGHALGFGHFGKVFVTNRNSKLHVAPRAVMNAIILGTQRDLLGTDNASYNSVYGNWPK